MGLWDQYEVDFSNGQNSTDPQARYWQRKMRKWQWSVRHQQSELGTHKFLVGNEFFNKLAERISKALKGK